MKTAIFFYSATGNSLWAARSLARQIGEADVLPMVRKASHSSTETAVNRAEAIGLVFPVHIWGLPRRVVDFVNLYVKNPSRYFFAVALNAGQVSATLLQLNRMLSDRAAVLSLGYQIKMPSNYIPWGGPGPEEEIRARFAAAEKKISEIAAAVRNRKRGHIERGPLRQRIVFSAINRLSFGYVPKMDKNFRTDSKCNGCGICEKICPNGNIRLAGGKPEWLHGCEQCLTCIQWCPREAVQWGKKTSRYPRYHHPDISLKDIIEAAKAFRGEDK